MGKTQDAIDRATAAVSKATTVEQSANELLKAVIATARENAGDVKSLNEAMDAFELNTQALSDAVVENTPAADTGGGNTSTGDGSQPS